MNDDEKAASEFLVSEGHRDIAYEPNGKIPPDFLINGNVAVEVRRLNQHFFKRKNPAPLETTRHSMKGRIRSLLHSYGPSNGEQSWLLTFTLRRPLPDRRRIETEMRYWLDQVVATSPDEPVSHRISRGFAVHAYPCTQRQDQQFTLGGFVDSDAGGFIVAHVIRNLPLCVHEKERKISAHRNRYATWWLVLVDHIAGHLDLHDRRQLNDGLELSSSFDRIAIINPSNPGLVLRSAVQASSGELTAHCCRKRNSVCGRRATRWPTSPVRRRCCLMRRSRTMDARHT